MAAGRAVLVAVTVLGATPAAAGPMSGIGNIGGMPGLERGIDEGIDIGPEVSVLGSFANGGSAMALGVDLVIAFYLDKAPDMELYTLDGRLAGRSVPRRWPWISSLALALHVGGVFDVEDGRRQLHLAAGSGLGWLGLALGMVWEDVDGVDPGVGFGPELRLRHRFGPSRHTWSVGVLARGELFVNQRDAHPDRVTVGAFVMWGW